MEEADRLGVSGSVENLSGPQAVQRARAMEKLGYSTLWIGELVVGRDPFAMAAYLLSHTERIKIGLCVANVWKREPATTINAARTLTGLFGDRFVLGVGISHQKFVDHYGMHYGKPYRFMREYVARMKAAPFLGPRPGSEPPILLAAQMPMMMKLGREVDGVFVTFAPPDLTARARAAVGPDKRVCVIQAFTMHTDPEQARAIGRQYTGYYSRLENYRKCLMTMGFGEDDFKGGGSDRLIDSIVAWGSEESLHNRLEAQFKAGADHVNVLALPDSADSPAAAVAEETLRVLSPQSSRVAAV